MFIFSINIDTLSALYCSALLLPATIAIRTIILADSKDYVSQKHVAKIVSLIQADHLISHTVSSIFTGTLFYFIHNKDLIKQHLSHECKHKFYYRVKHLLHISERKTELIYFQGKPYLIMGTFLVPAAGVLLCYFKGRSGTGDLFVNDLMKNQQDGGNGQHSEDEWKKSLKYANTL